MMLHDYTLIAVQSQSVAASQRSSSRKWQLVHLKIHSVMWFAEAVLLSSVGGVGSLSTLAGAAYTSLSALFFVGGLDPEELASFFLREKLREKNFKENSLAWLKTKSRYKVVQWKWNVLGSPLYAHLSKFPFICEKYCCCRIKDWSKINYWRCNSLRSCHCCNYHITV